MLRSHIFDTKGAYTSINYFDRYLNDFNVFLDSSKLFKTDLVDFSQTIASEKNIILLSESLDDALSFRQTTNYITFNTNSNDIIFSKNIQNKTITFDSVNNNNIQVVDNATSGLQIISDATTTIINFRTVNNDEEIFIKEDLVIDGDLKILGTCINLSEIIVTDCFVELCSGNTSDLFDSGFYTVHSPDSGTTILHSGLIRDRTDSRWKLFSDFNAPLINDSDVSDDLGNLDLNIIRASTINANDLLLNSNTNQNNNNISNVGLINGLTIDVFNNTTDNIAIYNNNGTSFTSTNQGNIAYGDSSLSQINDGSNNIAIGTSALNQLNDGLRNIAIGNCAGMNVDSNNNVLIGFEAFTTSSTADNTVFGSTSGRFANGSNNIFLGTRAAQNAVNVPTDNIVIGKCAGDVSGVINDRNVVIGYMAANSLANFPNISDKLIIANSNTAAPLILGDFSTPSITIENLNLPNTMAIDNGALLRIRDVDDTEYFSLDGPQNLSSVPWTMKLPSDGGTTTYFLRTDGDGETTWAPIFTPIPAINPSPFVLISTDVNASSTSWETVAIMAWLNGDFTGLSDHKLVMNINTVNGDRKLDVRLRQTTGTAKNIFESLGNDVQNGIVTNTSFTAPDSSNQILELQIKYTAGVGDTTDPTLQSCKFLATHTTLFMTPLVLTSNDIDASSTSWVTVSSISWVNYDNLTTFKLIMAVNTVSTDRQLNVRLQQTTGTPKTIMSSLNIDAQNSVVLETGFTSPDSGNQILELQIQYNTGTFDTTDPTLKGAILHMLK